MKNVAAIMSFFLLFFNVSGQSAGQEGKIQTGNQYYASGDYSAAAEQYESVLSSGYESAGLYFNLGNTYFKLNNIPASILFYEKARKLDPTDENIRFNLALANSRIIDKMEPLPEFFLKTGWKSIRDLYSSNLWATYGVAGFILALAFIAVFIIFNSVFTRKLAFWTAIVLLGIMFLSFLFSISSYREYNRKSSGIIFTPTVTVKSSPNEGSVDLFVIHEGTKVSITDKVEGWSEVRLANGNVGWVKTDTFRLI
jgi:tetratricopeptide (TPR) repeat protein